jgi:transcription-repair coupling factor (superfamily II helicase)
MPSPYQEFLLEQVDQCRAFARLVDADLGAGGFARLHGLSGSARAAVLARLQERLKRPVLVVAPDAEAAEAWYDDLLHFGVAGVEHFALTETLPYDPEEPIVGIAAHHYATLYRLLTGRSAGAVRSRPGGDKDSRDEKDNRDNKDAKTKALQDDKAKKGGQPAATAKAGTNAEGAAGAARAAGEWPFVVAPVEALQRRVPSREWVAGLVFDIAWGERFDSEDAARRLVDMGYVREGMVGARGEFSIRGHVFDVFPPQLEYPVRVDLFGDEIETIRFFDVSTQRSLQNTDELERVTVMPVGITALCARLAGERGALVGLDEWLPADTIVVLDTPEKYDAALDQFDRIALRRFEEMKGSGRPVETPDLEPVGTTVPTALFYAAGKPLTPASLFLTGDLVRRRLNAFGQLHLPQVAIQSVATDHAEPSVYDFGVTSYDTLPADVEAYLSAIRKKQGQDFAIQVVCDNEGQVGRLRELMLEHEIGVRSLVSDEERDTFHPRDMLEGFQDVVLVTGMMHTGFVFPDARLMIVTDREMFGRYKRRHVYRKVTRARPVTSIAEIQRGDYVVHADHGVGRFLGVRVQTIDGRETELLEIEYAEGTRLLVPIENVGHVQKFTSVEAAQPALDRLGGKRWQTRRKKSQEKIEQMARELLEIYAKREVAEGFAFEADTVWQREFEDSFLYQETGDQLRSIDEIKGDMMGLKPMDRLLCGDVGFGKTEVAMRAVFKCVQEKKQAAVLVPTTILAQQHFGTFRERFAEYPYRIEVVSRFRSDHENHEALAALKRGEVDVIVGTHRLLSNDVEFADLGLLVVDEEHRFGVKQKEKLKAMRASVDILTLSATPVPRTLHLALSGLRDMSTINTPPRDRLPIRTRVIRFVPEEIEEAVLRELNRGGQIYFVHNRVQSIVQVAERLKQIVPQARIAVGHGQMHEHELEKVMFDFIDRKYDILLATTIIESGLDIPNVNTIIINRADALGLAQLYQLRGRVGRDVKRAYAYLIVPDGRPITDTAVKRLRAIEEFTELGMGFQIAMRDLEIRGTGNILGAEQHGVIEAVGFELYCQMLEEAVRIMRGQGTPAAERAVEIKWPVAALLPAGYVPVESQRVAFYKRCSTARKASDIKELAEELRDRYGELPRETRNLLDVARLRLLSRRCGLARVAVGAKGFRIIPHGDLFDLLRRAVPLRDSLADVVSVAAEADGSVMIEMRRWKPDEGIPRARQVLRALMGTDN